MSGLMSKRGTYTIENPCLRVEQSFNREYRRNIGWSQRTDGVGVPVDT